MHTDTTYLGIKLPHPFITLEEQGRVAGVNVYDKDFAQIFAQCSVSLETRRDPAAFERAQYIRTLQSWSK